MALQGKLALVTGGGNGIGKEVSLLFAKEGASVVCTDIDDQGCQQTVKECTSVGDAKHLAIAGDISNSAFVDELAQKIKDHYGKNPSVVAHNAGIVRNLKGIEEETEDLFDTVIRVNLKGTFLVNKKFALLMREDGIKGSIINMSSIADRGFSIAPGYAASKGGVTSLSKSIGQEMAKYGIQVNSVHPGPIATKFAYSANVTKEEIDEAEKAPSATPMERHGTAEEVAQVCLFLASDKSSYGVLPLGRNFPHAPEPVKRKFTRGNYMFLVRSMV